MKKKNEKRSLARYYEYPHDARYHHQKQQQQQKQMESLSRLYQEITLDDSLSFSAWSSSANVFVVRCLLLLVSVALVVVTFRYLGGPASTDGTDRHDSFCRLNATTATSEKENSSLLLPLLLPLLIDSFGRVNATTAAAVNSSPRLLANVTVGPVVVAAHSLATTTATRARASTQPQARATREILTSLPKVCCTWYLIYFYFTYCKDLYGRFQNNQNCKM